MSTSFIDSVYAAVITSDAELAQAVMLALGGFGFQAIFLIKSDFEKALPFFDQNKIAYVFIDRCLDYPGESFSLCESLRSRGVICIGIDPLADMQPYCVGHFKTFSIFPKNEVHDELRKLIPSLLISS